MKWGDALACAKLASKLSRMRVQLEPVDRFLELMRDNNPCPGCGSSRVTVRRELERRGTVLRSECADCQRTRDVAELESR